MNKKLVLLALCVTVGVCVANNNEKKGGVISRTWKSTKNFFSVKDHVDNANRNPIVGMAWVNTKAAVKNAWNSSTTFVKAHKTASIVTAAVTGATVIAGVAYYLTKSDSKQEKRSQEKDASHLSCNCFEEVVA